MSSKVPDCSPSIPLSTIHIRKEHQSICDCRDDRKCYSNRIVQRGKLSPCGPLPWGTSIPDKSPGIYVVALTGDANASSCEIDADYLEPSERRRWIPNQPIIYIGQATRQTLTKRLGQFYRHKYDAKSPHRGGRAVKLLTCNLWVYWSQCANPRDIEHIMLDAFIKQVGQLPFGNRRK
jgi:hypothetical protein